MPEKGISFFWAVQSFVGLVQRYVSDLPSFWKIRFRWRVLQIQDHCDILECACVYMKYGSTTSIFLLRHAWPLSDLRLFRDPHMNTPSKSTLSKLMVPSVHYQAKAAERNSQRNGPKPKFSSRNREDKVPTQGLPGKALWAAARETNYPGSKLQRYITAT